ncbi:MAG: ABC transporter permease [Lachnospiraceae bacterium]|nr:ABC transporter permease [Lachnospiraceae bacterium]
MKNKTIKEYKTRASIWIWQLLSLAAAILLWFVLSKIPKTSRSFPFATQVIPAIKTMIERDVLWKDFASSIISILAGFALGFVTALPVGFLMAWYRPVQKILEPWIQFVRNIPALAYVPLVVISVGVGRKPQIIVIWLACFMTTSIMIYQGIKSVDLTLIKAARVLGAEDRDIFFKVIIPATTPFVITAVRLGLSAALTTLIASESTGAVAGMGMRIRSLSNTFETAPMLLYIILVGIIGMTFSKIVDIAERRLTGWQEKIEL